MSERKGCCRLAIESVRFGACGIAGGVVGSSSFNSDNRSAAESEVDIRGAGVGELDLAASRELFQKEPREVEGAWTLE